MSDISRRKFLKASVVGVGVGVAVEGCSSDGAPPAGSGPMTSAPPPGSGGRPPVEGPGAPPAQPTPPGTGGAPPPTEQPPPPPTGPPPVMQPPPGGMPPGSMGPAGMPLRALGNTGLMVSIVGFGSGSQYLGAPEAQAERLLHRAVELGINLFDTAISYGNGRSQVLLGKYLLPMYRDRIVLANKVHDRTAAGAQRQLEQSLANLKTDKIDILHFHDIGSTDEVSRIMAPGGAYETLARAKQQGVIRFIGVSGHTTGAILVDALRRIKPDLVMCPQNAARELGFTDMVIPHGQQNGIGLLGMKVTAQDALLNRGVPAEELVRYSLSLPVSAMVIGISSMMVLESCVNIARTLKPLTPAEMMMVNRRLASLDTQRCFPYHRPGYRDACYA
jgi:aryl-alcohol dehydrogenase-like predicted oxidoreductase